MIFSIIIPTYNRAEKLSAAIESVIKQTYKNWELIIVDDGSTDCTREKVEEFLLIEKKIRYFYQNNKERSAARNNGINKATGDWICFLDSDDLFYKNHLEEFKKLIIRNNFSKGIYFCGLSKGGFSPKKEKYDVSGNNGIEFVLLNTIGTPRACVYREILLKTPFNTIINNGEDKELWTRIVKNNYFFYHCKKTFIEIDHPERSINTAFKTESFQTIKSILKANKKIIRPIVRRKVLSDCYFNLSKAYIKEKNYLKALINLIASIFLNFKNIQTKHKLILFLSIIGLYKKEIFLSYR